jgi:hypothetical protein
MKNIIFVLSIFLASCGKSSMSPEQFIVNAKQKNASSFLFITIEARGKRDGIYHYYYSHSFLGKDTIDIPSIEFFDDFMKENEKHYLHEIEKLAKNKGVSKKESIAYAKDYAKKIDTIYQELGAINIISNPNRGKFIEFTLDEKCKVYYLEDATTLTPYWKDKFSKLQKVDEKWYYECK